MPPTRSTQTDTAPFARSSAFHHATVPGEFAGFHRGPNSIPSAGLTRAPTRLCAAAKIDDSGRSRAYTVAREAAAESARTAAVGRDWSAPRLEPTLGAIGNAACRDATDPPRPRDDETVLGVPCSVKRAVIAERALANSGVDSAPCEIAVELIGAFPSIYYFPMTA